MATATLTSKGQITLPKAVRRALNVDCGDRVDFVERDGEVIVRAVSKSAMDLFGSLRRPGQPALSLEEIDDAIGEAVSQRDDRTKRER